MSTTVSTTKEANSTTTTTTTTKATTTLVTTPTSTVAPEVDSLEILFYFVIYPVVIVFICACAIIPYHQSKKADPSSDGPDVTDTPDIEDLPYSPDVPSLCMWSLFSISA